ncbi:hypothetical protein L6R52_03905 [Myxococcota bacterium]|nr:hypothetical protein [Myxococcota bacterium]
MVHSVRGSGTAQGPEQVEGAAASATPSAAELIARDEGLRPDGAAKKTLKKWANGQLERVVDKVAKENELTPAERERLRTVLTETKDAKLREYWQRRAPLEMTALAVRSLAVTGVMLGVGVAAPGALIPAAIGVAVGLAGQGIVGHEMLGHALEGRAALEVIRMQRARGEEPVKKKGLLERLSDKMTRGVEARATKAFALDPEQQRELASALEDARVQKKREILDRKAPMELASLGATAAATIGACVGLGLIGPAAAVVMGASAVIAGLASAGLSLWKMRAALEGAASAQVQEIAAKAPEGSPVREKVAESARERERRALESARRIGDEFAKRFGLDDGDTRVLHALLKRVAHQKHKELLGERLGPTLAAPLGRGAAVATIAATAASSPALAASVVVGSVAESAVSMALLYKQLDSALEGAAYAYVKTVRRAALTAQANMTPSEG